jgi:hypothetical protein
VALPAVAALLWVALPALLITHAERAHDDEPEPVGTGSAGLLD